MLPYQLLMMIISISGLMSIIYLSFLIIFSYQKEPYRRYLIRFIISLTILVLSLFVYSQMGYAIISW